MFFLLLTGIGKSKSRSGSFRSLLSTIFKRGGSFKHKKDDKSETPVISTSSAASTDYFVKPKVSENLAHLPTLELRLLSTNTKSPTLLKFFCFLSSFFQATQK